MVKSNWIILACVVFLLFTSGATIAVPAQTFATLVNLDAHSDGPTSPLVQAAGGKLYGAATLSGHGSIFTVTPAGALTTLLLLNGPDGSSPEAGLVQGTDGSFYGPTAFGGANGFGAVFKINPSGTLTTLYSFCPQLPCSDGEQPTGGLLQASDGNFYGTTSAGGDSGNGTVFRITTGGSLTTLYRFDDTHGRGPSAALTQGVDGNLYGTTAAGGIHEQGTVFTITASGVLTTLHQFNGSEGIGPLAALVQGMDGDFYGTTLLGGKIGTGCGSGCGTIFRITSTGTFTTLYEFGGPDGAAPQTPLVQASDGNFYGATNEGGSTGNGTLFKITPAGMLTTLYTFCLQNGCPDGTDPYGLVQYTNGTFYGATFLGGANNDGTVYSLSLGLRPFVRTLPLAAQVGASLRIIGTNLSGATSVTFNGVPATFKVKSGTNIEATVPVGATTGTVQVVTPQRTLSSNVPFNVN